MKPKKLDFTGVPLTCSESRTTYRYQYQMAVIYQIRDMNFIFHTENISVGGMKLNAPFNPKFVDTSAAIKMTIIAPHHGKDYRFSVRGYFHARDLSVIVFDRQTQDVVSLFLSVI